MPPKKEEKLDDSFKQIALTITDAKTLILALRTPEIDVCGKACDALEKFALSSDRNRGDLVTWGILEPLVKLLSAADGTLRQLASFCLATLTTLSDCRIALQKSGLNYFAPLMLLLGADQTTVCHENACIIFDRLATEYCSRVDAIKCGLLPAITTLLVSPSADVKRSAVRVLLKLLDEFGARTAMVSLGTLPPLVALLDVDFGDVQRTALACVARCARTSENCVALIELGMLEKLVSFTLNKENKASHFPALQGLLCLVDVPGAITRLGVMVPAAKSDKEPATAPPLANLLTFVPRTDDEQVQLTAIACICKAANTPGNRSILMDFKAEAVLVARLVGEDPKAPLSPLVVSAACKALAALCQSRPNSEAVGSLLGIQKFGRLLAHESEDVVNAALSALASAVRLFPNNRKLVAENDVAPRILQLLSDVTSRFETKQHAASCVGSLAQTPVSLNVIKQGALEGLCAALVIDDVNLQHDAVRALAVLARDADVRALLAADSTSIKQVAGFLAHNDEKLVRVAAILTVACAEDTVCLAKLIDNGALVSLHNRSLANPNALSSFHNSFLSSAYSTLYNASPTNKYALTGFLSINDTITDGFYDSGFQAAPPPNLQTLSLAAVTPSRPILLINSLAVKAVVVADPVNDLSKSSSSKLKKHAPVVGSPVVAPSLSVVATWAAPSDAALPALVLSVQTNILLLDQLNDRASQLAIFVSQRMGGVVAVNKVSEYALEMCAIKQTLGSNVLPIGNISHGSYRERCLLYKYLAFFANVPCTLQRADFGQFFNMVYGPAGTVRHVVDVMHNPGQLVACDCETVPLSFWKNHKM